ncbi:MAG: hypothetical protein VB100_11820, partial [Angelakisella sp.]|nr:hypothetical protein [Angelakisella sp.]
MLQLVMGRAGTGKTTMILDQAIESARMGQYVMLIVPEQFSFETEKAIYTTLHGSDAMRMDVLSFSRLAENIFRTYGGLARKRLNDMSRLVLMKLALKETADNLQVYQRQSDKTTFVTTMLETVEELKSSGTVPWQLQEVANQAQSAHLKAKLKDISLIYEAYQAIIDRDYEDPLDDIAKASRLTCEKNFFAGKTIYIDGFDFFSPPERELIQNMMIQAWQITVALSADGLEYRGETDIFLSQKRTAHQLITFARANGISVKSPVMLTEIIRTSSQALHSVEALLRGENPDPALDVQGIKLVLCSQKYEEARFAAAQIHALVREKRMRYRDFAVVCRNMDDYELPVSEAFADYKIPIFYDKKESAMTQPIAVTAMAALDAVRGTYKTEAILKLARSPALGLNAHQVAKLENYCYVWTVEGKSWLEPFRNDPAGISGAAPESYREELSEIETIRKTLIKPLSTLKKSLSGCDGRGFVLGLYEYLETVHALDNLRNYFTSEYPDDDTFIQHNDALWGMMVDIMDLFCDTLGQVRYPVSVFTELFGLALSCAELGSIPNTLDQAIV